MMRQHVLSQSRRPHQPRGDGRGYGDSSGDGIVQMVRMGVRMVAMVAVGLLRHQVLEAEAPAASAPAAAPRRVAPQRLHAGQERRQPAREHVLVHA